MKRDYESVERRRSRILKLIREQDSVKVEDLADIFQMSTMSVRRDLQYLEDRNLITCFYGGARANAAFQCRTPEEEIALYRKLLGRYAATKELYILADHTKLENAQLRQAQYGTCTYERQVTLITDEKADPNTVESLRNKGMEVFQVGLNDINA